MRNTQTLLIIIALIFAAQTGASFTGEGCGDAGDCRTCHNMTLDDAKDRLKGLVDDVLSVEMSKVPGLWSIDVKKGGKNIPIFLDFSGNFLITGDVIELESRESLTRNRFIKLNKIDPSAIPTDDAIVIGNPDASQKIIVFDDPVCPYCKKIHPEFKKTVAMNPDVVFLIKMMPLKIHPDAYDKAKSIICSKSDKMLEASLSGATIPAPECETDQVDRNIALGKKLGITSTPTLVFPDGRVVPGFKTSEKILALLQEETAAK